MKTEELQALGLNEEQIKEVFKLNGKDIKAEQEKYEVKNESLVQQLNTATEGLKKFEGVDVDKLQEEIQKLNLDLSSQKQAFENEIKERDFSDMLNASIQKAGGRNNKAIKALLELDVLKQSKNQDKDIEEALSQLKKDNDYLFNSEQPINNPIARTNDNGNNEPIGEDAKLAAARAIMGLKKENN